MRKKLQGMVGKVYSSNNFGDFEIIEYNDWRNVKVRFKNSGYECKTTICNIRSGEVKDKNSPSVFGVGYIGTKYPIVGSNNRLLSEYRIWHRMLRRCYCPKSHIKHPTYKDCTVSENFKSYEYFYEWCQNQIGFNNPNWELDKDLLIKGNKLYAEDTCIFLPKEINLCLNTNTLKGHLPVGVGLTKHGKYFARISSKGKEIHLGIYETPEEAFLKYKANKESIFRELSDTWGSLLDPRAKIALYNRKVEITN